MVRLDLVPARVSTDDTDWQPVRCVVTEEWIYLFVDASDGPEQLQKRRIADFEGSNVRGWTVTLADDTVWTVRRAGGCACGSRLRGMRLPAEIRLNQHV